MAAGLRRPVGPGSGCGAGGWRVAGAARGAVVGGDPWRQDRGGVARADPSVRPVGMGQAHDPWRAAPGATPGVPPVVAWRVRPRVQARRAVPRLAWAPPVARQSHPWGSGQRMARGGGRTIHPVALSSTVARASQAGCSAARPPV